MNIPRKHGCIPHPRDFIALSRAVRDSLQSCSEYQAFLRLLSVSIVSLQERGLKDETCLKRKTYLKDCAHLKSETYLKNLSGIRNFSEVTDLLEALLGGS